MQRIHAVLFHQGAERLGEGVLGTVEGRERLAGIAAGQLSAAGQVQVATGLEMLEASETQLCQVRRQLVGIARLNTRGEDACRLSTGSGRSPGWR